MFQRATLPSAVLLTLAAAPLSGQELVDRVAAVRDGDVRITYAARAGVCGNGQFIGEDTPDGFTVHVFHGNGYSIGRSSRHVRPSCHEGPVRLVVEKRAGRIRDFQVAVGVSWRDEVDARDLGTVPAPAAADWLLDVAESHPDDDVIRRAMFAATLADSARLARRLLRLVTSEDARAHVRSQAMRRVSEVAAREGRADEADEALRGVVLDDGAPRALRERAVRELRETDANDGFLRDAFLRSGPANVRERIIRRIGESRTDANAAWIRSVAVDERVSTDLRERAIRELGEMGRFDDLRAMYADLRHPDLQERVLRVVAGEERAAASGWLREVATASGAHVDVRERAVRLLGEYGDVADLRRLYPALEYASLRERVLRILGERGDVASLAWIEEVARQPDERLDVRERAVRIMAEQVRTGQLVSLYDEVDARQLKERLIRVFADRRDEASLDKLRAIATDDPSSSLRRAAERRLR